MVGKEKIATALSGSLDPSICRGLYISLSSSHPYARQFGCDVVVVSRQLAENNYCWDRYITVKEMMHIFDGVAEACDTGEKFDALLAEFSMGDNPNKGEPHIVSETTCFWRALGLFCNERNRKDLLGKTLSGELTHYDVALRLRIPEAYVQFLFHPNFSGIIEGIRNGN